MERARGRSGERVDNDEDLDLIKRAWDPRPWASGSRPLYIRLQWTELTGRRSGGGWTHENADPVDIGALVDVVVSCARLTEDVPQVAELDLNPLMVTSSGCALVDVKLRLADSSSPPADEPRQLRRTT